MYIQLFNGLTLYIKLSNYWKFFVHLSKSSKGHDQQSLVKTVCVRLFDGWTVYVQLYVCWTVYFQQSNDLPAFVQLPKGSKVYDQQSIVKTVYVQLSDGWTVYVQLSNGWAVYSLLSNHYLDGEMCTCLMVGPKIIKIRVYEDVSK